METPSRLFKQVKILVSLTVPEAIRMSLILLLDSTMATATGYWKTWKRSRSKGYHILRFIFSLMLIKNEFLDVITDYLRLTDKDFL